MIMKTSDRLVIEKTGASGFTLIELVVVIATVAVLAALLLPALAGTKPNTQAFQCLENQRQLILAWQMYAQDNSDILPPNDFPYATHVARDGTVKNWVFGTMYLITDAIDAPGLGQGIQVNPALTSLALYNTNPAAYKCPADITLFQGHVRQRSVSMNSAVGTVWYSDSNHYGTKKPGSAVGGGWLPGTYNDSQTTYRTYGKTSSFTVPGPSSTWVIADENPNTINDGSLVVSMAQIVVDFPANYHGGGAGLAFADGHTEIHKWVDVFLMLPTTLNLLNASSEVGAPVSQFMSGPSQDVAWIQPRTSALK
jgi:prepilin-type N-terminal cleavage/methylation domain-containing protein/prepilin-type processing-associated H-X9-DG protein